MTAAPEPRLPPRPAGEWDEETRAALLPYLRRPERYLSGAPDAPPMPVVLELFANHLALSRSWLPFTAMLSGEGAQLDPAHRELLILRVAWRTHSGYEWEQHTRLGGEAGLTTGQLAAVPRGPNADVWSPLERSLLLATDEMIDRFAVSDDTWGHLASQLLPAQLLELLFVVGGYLCLAVALNSSGLAGGLPPDAPGGPHTAADDGR